MQKLIILALLCAPMWGATAYVKSTSAIAINANVAAAFAGNVTAGNVIAVSVAWASSSSTLSSIAKTAGTGEVSFTIVDNPTTCASVGSGAMAYGVVTTTGTLTVGSTLSASHLHIIAATEISGVDTTTPLDNNQHKMACQINVASSTDAITTGDITTTVNGDFIYSSAHEASGSALTVTAGTNYTIRENRSGASQRLATEDLVQSTAGAISGTWTAGAANGEWISGVMAFKPAGAASAKRRVLLIQ